LAIVGLLATKPRRLGSQEGRAGGELRALAGLLLFFVPGRAACRAEAAAHARPVAPGRAGLSPIIPCRAHARVGSKKTCFVTSCWASCFSDILTPPLQVTTPSISPPQDVVAPHRVPPPHDVVGRLCPPSPAPPQVAASASASSSAAMEPRQT
jgi:hypothetical protein